MCLSIGVKLLLRPKSATLITPADAHASIGHRHRRRGESTHHRILPTACRCKVRQKAPTFPLFHTGSPHFYLLTYTCTVMPPSTISAPAPFPSRSPPTRSFFPTSPPLPPKSRHSAFPSYFTPPHLSVRTASSPASPPLPPKPRSASSPASPPISPESRYSCSTSACRLPLIIRLAGLRSRCTMGCRRLCRYARLRAKSSAISACTTQQPWVEGEHDNSLSSPAVVLSVSCSHSAPSSGQQGCKAMLPSSDRHVHMAWFKHSTKVRTCSFK